MKIEITEKQDTGTSATQFTEGDIVQNGSITLLVTRDTLSNQNCFISLGSPNSPEWLTLGVDTTLKANPYTIGRLTLIA